MPKTRKNRRQRHTKGRRRTRKMMGGDKHNCIFVTFPNGTGLGNQLFIYATAIAVRDKIGLPLCILPSVSSHNPDATYRELLFKQGIPVELDNVKSRIDSAKSVLSNKSKKLHTNWSNDKIKEGKDIDYKISDTEPASYQNYNTIKSAIPIIRKDCAKAFEEKYPGFKDTISSKSAFMHIRRGDYIALKYSNVADEYYKRGLEILTNDKHIDNIYIISDDIEWCKGQKWESTKIKWFDNKEDIKDEFKALYLMSLCLGGACISASTFSTWGVILGADQNKLSTIIYPVNWVTGVKSSELKFPSWWTAVENN